MQTTRIAKELLLSKKLETTDARIAIIGICMSSTMPVDVNYVAGKMGSKAHLATVYRTLKICQRHLERVDFQEGKFRYEYMHTSSPRRLQQLW
jgi:Fe2+ or Zn2+ uptake regulation protein